MTTPYKEGGAPASATPGCATPHVAQGSTSTPTCARCARPSRLAWRGPHLGAFCPACGAWLGWLRQSPAVLAAAPPHPDRTRVLVYDNPLEALLAVVADAVETLEHTDPAAARRAVMAWVEETHR